MSTKDETQRMLVALELLLDSFATYRRTGDRLHLAHAARTLDDLKSDLDALMARSVRHSGA